MTKRLSEAIVKAFKRRGWTANPADPTAVVQFRWRTKSRRFGIELVGSWGVEAKVTAFGRTWRTYDNPFFVWLFDQLEGATYGDLY